MDESCIDGQTICGIYYGNPNDLGSFGTFNPNTIIAWEFDVPKAVNVFRFGMLVHALPQGVSNARLAVYTNINSAGTDLPNAKIAETSSFPLSVGANEFDITSVALPAGKYWMAYLGDQTIDVRQTSAAGYTVLYLNGYTFGSGLPATMPTLNSTTNGNAYNQYIVVTD